MPPVDTSRTFESAIRRRRRATFAGVTALLVATTGVAAERRVEVEPPTSMVAGDASLVAPSPGARGDGVLRASLFADYFRAPLALVTPSQDVGTLVQEQLRLHLAASFSYRHRWLVALRVPLVLLQSGEATPSLSGLQGAANEVALGDPRLMLRGRVWGEADGFALGLGLEAAAPLSTSTYAGSPGPVLRAFASAGHQDSTSFSAMNVGLAWRKSQTLPGILPTRSGPALEVALAAGVTLDRARSTRLGPELALSSAVGGGATLLDARSTVAQLLLHLQHRLFGGPLEVGLALGPSIGRAPGAAEYRAILSLSFSPEEPPPPPDTDADRVPNDSDMCPSLAGVPSEDPMMHGCPALPSDQDADGIPDVLDACPRTVGEASLVKTRHGCPKPRDRDDDGVVDPDDACPDVPGIQSSVAAQRGCPAPVPQVELKQAEIAISEQVQFETGTAVIRDESSRLLQQVADVLTSHPEIASCEVAGHTDDTGTAELNLRLSEARARAVSAWLVAHGVEGQRLSARGYGATRPIADNSTEEGRAKNRRVEFLIKRRAESGRPEVQP